MEGVSGGLNPLVDTLGLTAGQRSNHVITPRLYLEAKEVPAISYIPATILLMLPMADAMWKVFDSFT